MGTITTDTSVGDLVVANPGRTRIFEQLGIDYCCGGGKSLESACEEAGLDPKTVVTMLNAVESAPADQTATDWSKQPLALLVQHIVDTHHDFLRRELPRLERLVTKVNSRHGHHFGFLPELERVFLELKDDLAEHMQTEEEELFPLIEQLESNGEEAPAGLLEQLEEEHASAGDALATMRDLTNDYTPPVGACNSFRGMIHGLSELEADMHQHVHKENNILFKRARARVLA